LAVDVVATTKIDKVVNDQKITGEPELFNDGKFVIDLCPCAANAFTMARDDEAVELLREELRDAKRRETKLHVSGDERWLSRMLKLMNVGSRAQRCASR
jgi:hypothetical protein